MPDSDQVLPPVTNSSLELDERISRARPIVIERSDLQTGAQRWGFRSLTFFCWAFWVYLFMPLISVIAWAAGLTWAYQILVQGLELVELWTLLKSYGGGIGVLAFVYVAWAVSSFFRFRGIERRQLAPHIADHLLSESHHLSAAELSQMRANLNQTVPAKQLDRMFGVSED